MPIQISCSAPPFVAQKARKLLVPVQISLFGGFNLPTNCLLRISVLSSSIPGALSIQSIPNMWKEITFGSVVQTPNSFDPNNTISNFVAFPAFLDNRNPTAPDSYSATYQIDLLDGGNLGAAALESRTFILTGIANPAQSVNVAFALDHGSSMATTDASGISRLDRLKAAFVRGLALLRPDDSLGVTSYGNWNCAPAVPVNLGPATADQITTATQFSNALVLDDSRPTRKWQQSGLNAGRALSPTATVVLVTDGSNNNPAGQVITSPTVSTSALIVAEAPHSPPPAADLVVSPGGHYAIAAPQALGEFAIEKLLTQILIGLAGNVFIDDPQGSLKPGESQTYPIPLVPADRQLDLIVFSNDPDVLDVHVLLQAHPSSDSKEQGCRVEPEGKHPEVIRKKGVIVFRFTPPTANNQEFHFDPAVVVHRRVGPSDDLRPVRYNLLMVADSDLLIDAQATSAGTTVGSDLLFSAVLSECGHAWDFPETRAWVELSHPDGFQQKVELQKVPGAPGRFQGTLRSFRPGTYTAHFIATGKPFFGHGNRRFRRECVRTVAVFPARDCCQPQEPRCDC